MARILCIEDEELIRRLVVEELLDERHEAFEACNGEEGLKAIIEHKPDLVLCDVNMPVMDGYQLLTALREHHPELADMPFIFLSALAERQDIIAGRKLGADDYLTKPIDFEMMLISIETRLNQVARMDTRKQQQMVKLYKALANGEESDVEDTPEATIPPRTDPATEPGPAQVSGDDVMTVAIVCNEEVDLSAAEDAMIKVGHHVTRFESGSAFQRAINGLKPDLLLISFDTIDTQAPFLMKVLGGKHNVAFGSVVFVPPALSRMCGTSQTSVFDAYVKLPASKDQMLKTINEVFTEHRAGRRQNINA